MPDNTDVNINYNEGAPEIAQDDPLCLYINDTVTLQLSGFPTDSRIESIEFFTDPVKQDSIGSWTASDTKGTISSDGKDDFTCELKTVGDYTGALITDVEHLTGDEDDPFWYSVTVSYGTMRATLDPELINKPGQKKTPNPGTDG